ncbi:MAG: glycosyltransferase [Sedimentisphaerales bacterium]|nr:glycosyltransferase [Sedimentisphaerales bacterium]
MKIAVVVDEFPVISETFIINHITGLLELGYDVDIYARKHLRQAKVHPDVDTWQLMQKMTFFPEGRCLRFFKVLGLTLFNLIRHPVRVSRAVSVLSRRRRHLALRALYFYFYLLHKSYDIIHCHYGVVGNFALGLKMAVAEFKLVTSFHGHDVNKISIIGDKDVYKELFKCGDLFIANTNFTRQQMIALGCPEDRAVVLPVSLRCDKFPFQTRTLPVDQPVALLTIGRLVEMKGYEYSLKAIAEVIKKYQNIRYSIIGDGPLKDELVSLMRQLHLEEYVEFLGMRRQDEIIEYYQQSQIFILPSATASDGDREGQALVLQEAQACGLPVISTLHNGIPDGVLDGRSGFLVPEKDSLALAERIIYLIEHPEVWESMGRCGREFVENKYDTKMVSKQLDKIYQNIPN